MTASVIQDNTYQLLQSFDKENKALWEKALNSLTLIYQEEMAEQRKREEQKARIRSMVGVFKKIAPDNWQEAKEEYLREKYL